jgi:predicted RNase H-like HicB family nuclease
MKVQFTAVFRPVPGGYVGFVEELPGANTQGVTLEEARANLEEAVGADVIREPLTLTA